MKKNSLIFKTLLYFAIFSLVILVILWILQINLLGVFYQKYQIKTVTKIANIIEKNPSVALSNLEDYAYKNNMCIEVYTINGTMDYNFKNPGCLLNSKKSEVLKLKLKMMTGSNNFVRVNDPTTKVKNLIYLVKIDRSNFVFLNVTLEDLSITTSILKHQIVYLFIGLLITSIIIAIFISKLINKPILALTNQAKELGRGNFNVKFASSNIEEIDELSNVLTVAALEMEKTDKVRRELLANVSHDLKTPLTMIRAYAEKIRDISYKDQDKRENDLKVIIDEADRLNLLVNDILELSKLENSKETLQLEKYDLSANLKEIMSRFSILENDNYEFILNIPEKSYVFADRRKIEQVIYNLINNAIEHTGDDLKVYITIKENKKDYLVSIKDTGKGLSEEEKKVVWNKYYKTDKTHKRNVVGTGLGLSIVKKILEAHNFEYGINSVKNEFTDFYFKIKKSK